ncbi:MAG: rhomboid family intramembrane serine protease [Crocinitomicaceae bacterium]|nr:rhomboid family intramembrane serine protease [Crocinitomicaceae bacterium]
MSKRNEFGSTTEAIVYPVLLVIVMWMVFWADQLFELVHFYKFGIRPQELNSLKGIILMPLIHSKQDIAHIFNNSFPALMLLGALIYYYRSIALKVFVLAWLLTGLGVWTFAADTHAYHIGMSGVIYALVGFLFTSGVLRNYRPLQAISLFVTFIYGSLIWGIFPMDTHVSWEGHLMGLISGVILAFAYRNLGPQPPKYLYEIEHEMGIEPPDFEGEWNEKVRLAKLRQDELERLRNEQQSTTQGTQPTRVVFHYVAKPKKDQKKDGNDQQ